MQNMEADARIQEILETSNHILEEMACERPSTPAEYIDPFLSRERAGSNEGVCSICLEELPAGSEVVALSCGHKNFHADCMRGWLQWKQECPICRSACVGHECRKAAPSTTLRR